MVWLYVPELEDLRSDLVRSLLTESCVTSRGKPMQPHALSRAWAKGGWIRHLSGLTLPPLMAHRGVELWISSLAATLANPLASQENVRVSMTVATCGRTWHVSSKTFSQACAFLKMFPVMSPSALSKCEPTFKEWVTTFKQESLARQKSVPLTSENDSSFLPTPTAVSYGNNKGGAAGRVGKVRHSLESMAKHSYLNDWMAKWPTPTVHGNYNQAGASPNSGDGLETAVRRDTTGGNLNPMWVEWLMGFPIGWTVCEPLGTP